MPLLQATETNPGIYERKEALAPVCNRHLCWLIATVVRWLAVEIRP